MTPSSADRREALPIAAQTRLDRFASAFQRLDSNLYPAFSAASHDPEERMVALARVQELIGPGPRRAAVLAALADFREYAVRSATESLGGYHSLLLTRTNASSPEERLRFLSSLELAVAAVILWDEIESDEREALLGPWIQMAIRAAAA